MVDMYRVISLASKVNPIQRHFNKSNYTLIETKPLNSTTCFSSPIIKLLSSKILTTHLFSTLKLKNRKRNLVWGTIHKLKCIEYLGHLSTNEVTSFIDLESPTYGFTHPTSHIRLPNSTKWILIHSIIFFYIK